VAVSRIRFLAFVAVVCLLAATPIAQQPKETATQADVELWVAAVDQIQREKHPRTLALMNETLTAAEFQDHLSRVTAEPILVDKLLRRNQSLLVINSTVKPSIELVDASTVRKPGSADLDMDVIGERFGQQRGRLVRLSLPVFSDDASRALVFTWTAGGFDHASGGGYVFERRQGQWIVVGYLAAWIT
jgi:hypothetical protein